MRNAGTAVAAALFVVGLALLPCLGQEEPKEEREHVVYVPFDQLKSIVLRPGDTVVLSYQEYRSLRERARQAELLSRARARVAAVLERAEYNAEVEDQLVRVRTTWEVRAVRPGWAGIPFHLGSGAIASLSSETENVLIRALGGGNYELLLFGPTQARVELQLTYPVQTEPGTRYVTFFFPPAGVGVLTFRLPEANISIKLSPDIVFHADAQEESTLVKADIGGLSELTVSWFPKAEGAEGAGLATAQVRTRVSIGGGMAETESEINYEVLRGGIDQLRVRLPRGARVLDVESAQIQRWETASEDGQVVVVAHLYETARDEVSWRIRFDQPLPDGPVALGHVVPLDVVRATGVLAVRLLEDFMLTPVELRDAVQITAADVPTELRSSGSAFFRFYSPQFLVRAELNRVRPWVRARSITDLRATRTAWRVTSTVLYDIARASTFRVSLLLPPSFSVDAVECERMDRYDLRRREDGQELTVTFKEPQRGEVGVRIEGTLPFSVQPEAAEWHDIELRVPELSGVDREESLVRVLVPEFLEVVSRPEGSQSVRPLSLADLEDPNVLVRPAPGERVAGLYAIEGHPARIGLRLRRRPPRVVASVLNLLDVHQQTVTVRTTVAYAIQYSGVGRFRLVLPKGVPDTLHVRGADVREHTLTPGPGEDERTLLVQLQSDRLGTYHLTIEYELPLKEAAAGETEEKAGELDWQPPRVLDVERELGEIAVTRDPELVVVASAEGVEPIDPRELTLTSAGTPVRLAYRYFAHPVRLHLRAARPKVKPVVETLIRRSLAELVIPQDGTVTVNAVYELTTAERQRLRIAIPKDARILSVQVNGRTTLPELVPGAQTDRLNRIPYLVDVTREEDVDKPLFLGLSYEMNEPVRLATYGRVDLVLPVIAGNVAADEQFLLCWVPSKWQPLSATGFYTVGVPPISGFAPVPTRRLPGDVEELRAHLPNRLTNVGAAQRYGLYCSFRYRDQCAVDYVRWTAAYVVVSGLVVLAAAVLLLSYWEFRLTVVALALVAFFAAYFARPEHAYVIGQAGLIGTVSGVGLWLAVGLVRLARQRSVAAAARQAGPDSASPGEPAAPPGGSEDDQGDNAASAQEHPPEEERP